MGQYRIQRLNDQLRDEISQLILRGEVKDPRVSTFLSINRVEVTSDLSYAKVYFTSLLDDDQKKLEKEMNEASHFIRGKLSSMISLRHTPELHFIFDTSIEYGKTLSV